MDHFEMVEKLREKANVSYEEAKAALEASDWDLLEAIVLLESQGKTESASASYSTREEEEAPSEPEEENRFRDTVKRVVQQLTALIEAGNRNYFQVYRKGSMVLSLPLTVLALLLLFMFWWVVPAVIIGLLFFGCTYKVKLTGHEAEETINSAMDKAAKAAEKMMGNDREEKQGEE